MLPPADCLAGTERHAVDQHEGNAAQFGAAIDPGMVGPVLDQDVACLEVERRVVQVHVDFTGNDYDIIQRFGAVHFAGSAGWKLNNGEAGSVRRRRRADNTGAHVFVGRDIDRHCVGTQHHRRDSAAPRLFVVGCGPIHHHDGLTVRIVPGYDAPDDHRYIGPVVCHGRILLPPDAAHALLHDGKAVTLTLEAGREHGEPRQSARPPLPESGGRRV